jgi:hypothetical protein
LCTWTRSTYKNTFRFLLNWETYSSLWNLEETLSPATIKEPLAWS